VALGTLIPIACSTTLVVFPSACRRVDLPLRAFAAQSIWPALWPAALLAIAYSTVVPAALPKTLTMVALESALGGALYLALFSGVAIGRRDRALYATIVGHLVHRPRLAPA
jgi:hypothetical protein